MNQKEKEFILKYYGEVYNEECGGWNTSLACKWIDFEETRFFEDHFLITNAKNIMNIGIGPGVWDRYLSYRMNKEAKLVSIDIDNEITETFKLCLINENNSHHIEVENIDFFKYQTDKKFDIITLIGSAALEIGNFQTLFAKILSLLTENGALYYMTIDKNESKEHLEKVIDCSKYTISIFEQINRYGIYLTFVKIAKI